MRVRAAHLISVTDQDTAANARIRLEVMDEVLKEFWKIVER
jgi:hypothetical protein